MPALPDDEDATYRHGAEARWADGGGTGRGNERCRRGAGEDKAKVKLGRNLTSGLELGSPPSRLLGLRRGANQLTECGWL